MSLYALRHVYAVYVQSYVWSCHRDIAGFVETRNGTFIDTNNYRAIMIAHKRSNSRFSAETREVEGSREFIDCMSKDFSYGSYWDNYSNVVRQTTVLAFLTGLLGLIIFPRFWRRIGRDIGDWVTMKG
jgi:hypothetical protein